MTWQAQLFFVIFSFVIEPPPFWLPSPTILCVSLPPARPPCSSFTAIAKNDSSPATLLLLLLSPFFYDYYLDDTERWPFPSPLSQTFASICCRCWCPPLSYWLSSASYLNLLFLQTGKLRTVTVSRKGFPFIVIFSCCYPPSSGNLERKEKRALACLSVRPSVHPSDCSVCFYAVVNNKQEKCGGGIRGRRLKRGGYESRHHLVIVLRRRIKRLHVPTL